MAKPNDIGSKRTEKCENDSCVIGVDLYSHHLITAAESDYYRKEPSHVDILFHHCPVCGEAIDAFPSQQPPAFYNVFTKIATQAVIGGSTT